MFSLLYLFKLYFFQDVEVASLAMHALDMDDLEEDFWADDSDDSDVEEPSTDDDPKLSSERWDCLTCGIKNKPFVRYCGKCWQVRVIMCVEFSLPKGYGHPTQHLQFLFSKTM